MLLGKSLQNDWPQDQFLKTTKNSLCKRRQQHLKVVPLHLLELLWLPPRSRRLQKLLGNLLEGCSWMGSWMTLGIGLLEGSLYKMSSFIYAS